MESIKANWKGIVIVILILGAINYYYRTSTKNTLEKIRSYNESKKRVEESIDTTAILHEVASEMNKQCPYYIDSLTMIKNIFAAPDRIIQYNYTIKLDTTRFNMKTLKDKMKSVVLNGLKTQPQFKTLGKYNVTFIYNYSLPYGEFIFKLIYPPSKYSN